MTTAASCMHTCMYDYITKGQEGEPENSSWVSEPAKTSNHRERERGKIEKGATTTVTTTVAAVLEEEKKHQ